MIGRLAALLAFAAPLLAAPSTLTVAADGSAPFRSIQAAVDSVTEATREKPVEIVVRPGHYFEMITTRDWVNITGADRDACIIVYDRKPDEPHHKTHVISATSTTILRNLTLIG